MFDEKEIVDALYMHSPNPVISNNILSQSEGFVSREVYLTGRGGKFTPTPLNEMEDLKDQLLKEEQYGLNELMKFPTDIFPEVIQDFIKAQAKALPVPEDFVGVGMLGVVSATIGNTTLINVKNSWTDEGCNVWLCIIADPSVRKTAALKASMSPLFKLEKELHLEFQSLKQHYKQNLEQYNLWKAKIKKDKATNEDMPEEPVAPVLRRIVVIKNTMEGLFKVLGNNPNGVIRFNDELKTLFTELNKYRNGDDRQTLLELFSRNRITIDLKLSEEPEIIDDPFVTIMGGTQPETIEPIIVDGVSDGLSARFLFSYPETAIADFTDYDVSNEIKEAYEDAIINLYWSRPKETRRLNLSSDAYEYLKSVINGLRAEMRAPDFPQQLLAPYGKLDGYLVRFTLILHVLAYQNHQTKNETMVDKETVRKAHKLVGYFKSHMRKVYNRTGGTTLNKNCLKLVELVKKKGKKTDFGYEMTFRDIERSHVFGKGKTTADAVFEVVNMLKNESIGTYEMKEIHNGVSYKFILFI
ncbi:DUF3987 domain-containing protein [Neobacillus sp. 179-C4.2 HS]|uniref:DUF3987 domain-containing protein n=1 Tax=Neobacillus driksii TaxID=3035913 RepID=A0ABV4YNY2_9BACI|nr:DUF3987 domain-containing protein [Neobacillus sp. 179.-C4.2 HS]MDP5197192.1 DUF3987 domain-containing protein [Neobacillus sp. 179.-C4.2 HS]